MKTYEIAKSLGLIAFMNGTAKAPCQDKALMALIAPNIDTIKLLDAWTTGFHSTNLSVKSNGRW